MDEVIKAFRHFIARDLVFILAGATVIASFLHAFDRLPGPESSWVLWVLLGGLGYFVAYALQDGLCLTPILTVAYVKNPNRFVRFLYRRFLREDWREIRDDVDLHEARSAITDERLLTLHERLVTLKQVGTAGGPCLVACSVIYLVKWYAESSQGGRFDLAVGIASAVVGVLLVLLGWLKGAQQAEFVVRHGVGTAGFSQHHKRGGTAV